MPHGNVAAPRYVRAWRPAVAAATLVAAPTHVHCHVNVVQRKAGIAAVCRPALALDQWVGNAKFHLRVGCGGPACVVAWVRARQACARSTRGRAAHAVRRSSCAVAAFTTPITMPACTMRTTLHAVNSLTALSIHDERETGLGAAGEVRAACSAVHPKA